MALDVSGAGLAVAARALIRVPTPPAHPAEARRASMAAELREGLRFVLNWRGLAIVMGLSIVLNFTLSPGVSLMPLLVTLFGIGFAVARRRKAAATAASSATASGASA